jgi:Protein of unknown function (DUF2281)
MIAQPSKSTTNQPSTLETIQTHLQCLDPEQQQQVLNFVEFLVQKNQLQEPQKTIWEKIDEAMAEVPNEAWEKMPTDGSYQYDH